MGTGSESIRSDVNNRRGLRRLLAATQCSCAGLVSAWRNEEAFRQEVVVGAVLIPAAFWVGTTSVERLLLLGTVLLVLIVELLNSAVECTIDRIGTDHHPLSGRAKDISSAAVFLSLVMAVTTWGMLLWDRLAAL
jgi:diacylglycerol kinase (ATP)